MSHRVFCLGKIKAFLQKPELDPLGFVSDRENPESSPLVDDLVKGAARFGHELSPVPRSTLWSAHQKPAPPTSKNSPGTTRFGRFAAPTGRFQPSRYTSFSML